MTWKTIREASESGTSLSTWKRRVASGEWPSYLEPDPDGGPGTRWVWDRKGVLEQLAVEVRDLRELVEEITSRQASAPPTLTEVRSPCSQAKRPAQRPPGPSPLRPADASDVPGWRDSWAELVRREGSAAAAGRLLGVGQPTSSRWSGGSRKPQPQAQQRIVDLAAQLGGAQGGEIAA